MNKKAIKYILIFFSYFLYEIYIYMFLYFIKLDLNSLSILNKNITLFIIDLIYMIILIFLFKKEIKEDKNKFNLSLLLKYLPIYLLGIILMGLSN